jgi:hypothetical protein
LNVEIAISSIPNRTMVKDYSQNALKLEGQLFAVVIVDSNFRQAIAQRIP